MALTRPTIKPPQQTNQTNQTPALLSSPLPPPTAEEDTAPFALARAEITQSKSTSNNAKQDAVEAEGKRPASFLDVLSKHERGQLQKRSPSYEKQVALSTLNMLETEPPDKGLLHNNSHFPDKPNPATEKVLNATPERRDELADSMGTVRLKAKPALTGIARYRDGGDGFVYWAEENVRIPVYERDSPVPKWVLLGDLSREPCEETGRSFWDMWCNQKAVLKQALQMKDGRLKHRLIIFCWPRGEGKSAVACLIQLWKFFCFPQQQIMLGANSKDQVKFVHYTIMQNIILNSPKLLAIVGRKNVQEKELRLCDRAGNVGSMIRSISSFSGIVSNITGYSFSEMFDMKNPKFFVQLDGSTRNMPNALGVIDSTVSAPGHILAQMYKASLKANPDPSIFFHYRCSQEGRSEDMWHPYNTQAQLDSYRAKFPAQEFARYFQNLWSSASNRFFTIDRIHAMHYIGAGNLLGCQHEIISVLEKARSAEEKKDTQSRSNTVLTVEKGGLSYDERKAMEKPAQLLQHISSVYSLKTPTLHSRNASLEELEKLTKLYDTDWVILCGVDRADPMKTDKTKGAKTQVVFVAKGLPGSRSNPSAFYEEGSERKFIYFLIGLQQAESNTLDEVKFFIKQAIDEYDGLEMLCSERWGMWDIDNWCEENELAVELVSPVYDRQKLAFSELYNLMVQGLFKAPETAIIGMKMDDVLEEEFLYFDYNPNKKWYGSCEKGEKSGVQDDTVFALAWAIYGGRNLGVHDLRSRSSQMVFGEVFSERTIGVY